MKIYVNRVPDEGLKERMSYDPTTLDMQRDDIALREPFDVEAAITKVGRELVVNVDIRCTLQLSCARCLKEFPMTIAPTGILSYQVSPNDVVDITDDVRQEVMLAYPMIPVCSTGCKGLCPSCGQDLNVGSCSHHATSQAPGSHPDGGRRIDA